MRPPGQIRLMTMEAMTQLARERRDQERRGATWRDALQRLVPQGVSRDAVRNTVKNLARAGQLKPVGTVTVPDAPRPLVAYEPVHSQADAAARCGGALPLMRVTRGWARG